MLSALFSTLLCQLQSVSANERRELIGGSNSSVFRENKAKLADLKLSNLAVELAKKLGLWQEMEEFERLKNQAKHTVEPDLRAELKMLKTKQDLLEKIEIVEAELNSSTALIDQEIASANEIHAHLAEKRDKAVRINTYADFLNGGVTGVVSGALAVADLNHLNSDIIDTVEGAVQSGLAAWAFRQQQGEKRMSEGVPSMLSHLIDRSPDSQGDYPPSVGAFLSISNDGGKSTIVSKLVDRWYKLDLCLRHQGHREDRESRLKKITKPTLSSQRDTIELLEDRDAMLIDLRATLQQMRHPILELVQFVHGDKRLS